VRRTTRIPIKALKCNQNGKEFFSTVINSSILKETCYVARRDEDPRRGFQRVLNEFRAKEIANYLDKASGVIPTAIILSAQEHINFIFDDKTSEVSFSIVEKGFLVIDGQHRLYGLITSKHDYNIPVIIFNKLKTSDEVSLFIDINTTQKGVPTSLLLDIKHLSGKETKREEKQRELFDKLNSDSCLAGYLSPTKSKVGKISRTTFNSATSHIFDNVYFQDKTIDILFKGIKNYLEASERALFNSKTQKGKLTSSVIFKALFSIFNDVTEKTLKIHSNLKVDSIYKIIEPISKLNYDTYTGTNMATIQKMINDMKREINQYDRFSKDIDGNMF